MTEVHDKAPFLTDWRKYWRGEAWAVAQPRSTAEVAALVKWCAEHGVPIVPQGGNTGLSGGATPDRSGDAIVLSTARLNRVRAVDGLNNTLVVEAGCLLADVQRTAERADRLFPLNLAAEGSCTIGGNLATNAGGAGVLRYGNARDLCLGLEVVTAQGEIWDGLRGLRKDNTGYDLRDLFIGSEGTLGVITAAVLKLFSRPRGRAVAIVGVPSPAAALALFDVMRTRLEAALSAFELFSHACLDLVIKYLPSARAPLARASAWYVLVEVTDMNDDAGARESIEAALAVAIEQVEIDDAVLAGSIAQAKDLWALRENISEAQGAVGPNIKHDISVPISIIGDFIVNVSAGVEQRWPIARIAAFGHVGDGNIHFNAVPAAGADHAAFKSLQSAINSFVHDAVAAQGGSISAEHGLGVLRRDEVARYKSAVERDLMSRIKLALDPKGIMNPNKVLCASA